MEKIIVEDWREGASIVGLIRYLRFKNNSSYKIGVDEFEFDDSIVNEEGYLEFVEKFFSENMYHLQIEELLRYDDEMDKDKIALVNKNLSANTVLKRTFQKIKFNGENREEILNILQDKEIRKNIILETFKNGKSLYANFANSSCLIQKEKKVCRLNGYYVDMNRKSKGVSFGYIPKAMTAKDSIYYDYIPFAFSRDREALFINCNVNLKSLIGINDNLFYNEENKDNDKNVNRSNLLKNLKKVVNILNYDVEIIMKTRDKEYYETLYLRRCARDIIESLTDREIELLSKPCKVERDSIYTDDKWVPVANIVAKNIVNNNYIDGLIEFLLKAENKNSLISMLIKINRKLYKEGKGMKGKYAQIIRDAKEIKNVLPSNKLRTYEQKLVSAITLRDYDRVKEIMLHLSSYSQRKITGLVDLFEDFEGNKNLAYTFINALNDSSTNIENEGEEEKNEKK